MGRDAETRQREAFRVKEDKKLENVESMSATLRRLVCSSGCSDTFSFDGTYFLVLTRSPVLLLISFCFVFFVSPGLGGGRQSSTQSVWFHS